MCCAPLFFRFMNFRGSTTRYRIDRFSTSTHKMLSHEMSSSSTKKQVVILGGGYAGCYTAVHLDRMNSKKEFEITLVSPREGFMLHKVGTIRAAVTGTAKDITRVLVPTTHLFSKNNTGKVVVATCTGVNPAEKTVQLSTGAVLKFDVLVLATGARNTSLGEPPTHTQSLQATTQYFTSISQDFLRPAKRVVVVGSGPVGLEAAGELRALLGNEVKITIVTRGKELLPGPTRLRGVRSMEKLLSQLKIDLVFEDEVVLERNDNDEQVVMKTNEGVCLLKSGKQIECDVVVFAAGMKLNTDFLPSEWLDSDTKEVIVNVQTMEVTPGVFAFGDIAKTGHRKMAYIAMQDSLAVAKNVVFSLKNQEKRATVSRTKQGVMLVSMGPNKGRGLLPIATLGNWVTTMIKNKDLFTTDQWQFLGVGKKAMPKA